MTISNEDYEKNRGLIQELDEQVLKLQLKSSKDDEQYTLLMDDSDNIDEDFKRLAEKLSNYVSRIIITLGDKGVVYFEKNKSFTGESVAAFHLHGSSAVIKKVLLEL